MSVSDERIEARAREILAKAKGRPGAAMAARQAKLIAETQLRHEDALEAARAEGLREGLREGLKWASDKARTLKTLRVWLPTGNDGDGEVEHVTKHGVEIAEAIDARLSEMDRQPVDEGSVER